MNNSYAQACDDVLKAIEDLRVCLDAQEKSGSVPVQVALSLQENLNAIALQTRHMQQKS